MKIHPVLKDYLRRWKLAWLFSSLLLVAITPLPFVHSASSSLMLFVIIFLGSMPLSFDLTKGWMRAVLQLPVSRKDIADGCFFVTVQLPTLFTIVLTLLSQAVYCFFTDQRLRDLDFYLLNYTSVYFILGTQFFALTGMKSLNPKAPRNGLMSGLMGALWGLSFGGIAIILQNHPNSLNEMKWGHWVFYAVTGMLTFLGYQERHALFGDRLERIAENHGPSNSEKSFTTNLDLSFGGFAYLFKTLSERILLFILIMSASFMFFAFLTVHKGNGQSIFEEMFRMLFQGSGTPMMFILIFVSLTPALQIRLLRVIPVSARQLTFILILCPLYVSLERFKKRRKRRPRHL